MKEPVRKYVYGILSAIAAVLVLYGVLTDTEVVAWMAVAQAVLAVPFVEAARSRVVPSTKDTSDGKNSAVRDDTGKNPR